MIIFNTHVPTPVLIAVTVFVLVFALVYFCLPTYAKELDRAIDSKRAEIARMDAIADPELCCCGDTMNHSPWDFSHQPVSMRDYMLEPLRKQLADLEKERASLQ